MANTIVSPEEWAAVVQERLSDVALWNIINDVQVVNGGVYNNPYETHASFQSHTRGSAYTHQNVTFTNETATVNQSTILPQQIDRADLVQSKYASLINLAKQQGVSAGEKLDALTLGAFAGWTDFGQQNLDTPGTGGSTQISVTVNNIDDMLDSLDIEIDEAKGNQLANRNGKFVVWRAKDFAKLKTLARSQGFSTADDIIMNGMKFGMKYMGWEHYVSNQHTANHVFAGIKKVHFLGVAPGAFPMVYEVEEPTMKEAGSNEAGNLSAIAMVTRMDYVFKSWANMAPVLFDVNVV